MFLTGTMGFKNILIFIAGCSNILFGKKKFFKVSFRSESRILEKALHKIRLVTATFQVVF